MVSVFSSNFQQERCKYNSPKINIPLFQLQSLCSSALMLAATMLSSKAMQKCVASVAVIQHFVRTHIQSASICIVSETIHFPRGEVIIITPAPCAWCFHLGSDESLDAKLQHSISFRHRQQSNPHDWQIFIVLFSSSWRQEEGKGLSTSQWEHLLAKSRKRRQTQILKLVF